MEAIEVEAVAVVVEAAVEREAAVSVAAAVG
jgi:hypothetical protein